MTFIELLLAAKEGSASAFEILFDRYKNLLRKYSVIMSGEKPLQPFEM